VVEEGPVEDLFHGQAKDGTIGDEAEDQVVPVVIVRNVRDGPELDLIGKSELRAANISPGGHRRQVSHLRKCRAPAGADRQIGRHGQGGQPQGHQSGVQYFMVYEGRPGSLLVAQFPLYLDQGSRRDRREHHRGVEQLFQHHAHHFVEAVPRTRFKIGKNRELIREPHTLKEFCIDSFRYREVVKYVIWPTLM